MRSKFEAQGRARHWLTSPVAIWAIVTLTIAFTGPFGTYTQFSFPERIVFWAPPLFVLAVWAQVVRRFTCKVLGITDFVRGGFLTSLAVAIASAPVCKGMFTLLRARGIAPTSVELAVFFFLSTFGVGALLRSLAQTSEPPKVIEVFVAPKPEAPRILQRLPEDMHAPLVSIAVRNHHVDVTTDNGATELLLRLSDAIAETEPEEGGQVHRSYWVAWRAVESYQRESQKQTLVLKNGTVVPVSKTYRDLVEERFTGTQMAEADKHSTANVVPEKNGAIAASVAANPPV